MPYTLATAPVRSVLTGRALRIWVRAYNAAVASPPSGRDPEEYAARVAWAAVKKAGYRKMSDGTWRKDGAQAAAEILRQLVLGEEAGTESEDVEEETASRDLESATVGTEWERAVALALPARGTPSKIYAEFKLLSFGEPNRNKDGFLAEDVTDEVVAALVGSPIYLQEDASAHPMLNARATARARFQAGVVTQAERRADGVYCVGALQREIMEDRGIAPDTLAAYAVSMEVMFDRTRAKYTVGGRTVSYQQAVAAGIASPPGVRDDRERYDARWIVPLEFHAVALLRRGRNADPSADVLKVAAERPAPPEDETPEDETESDELEWAPEDEEADRAWSAARDDAGGAVLTTKARQRLPRRAFAYVDAQGRGYLPIHDAAHVRNALARLNQTKIPVEAKRAALRKILRAAKRFGVEVDMSSDVVKAYSITDSLDALVSAVRSAFYEAHKDANAQVLAVYDDYLLAQFPAYVAKIPFTATDGNVTLGAVVRGRLVFEAEDEAHGARAAAAREELEALRQQYEQEKAEAVARAAQEAVEAYRAREQRAAARLRELEEIAPFAPDEREALAQRVREVDDAAFAAMKVERLQRRVAELEQVAKAAAATGSTPPTLRPAQGTEPRRPYYVTVTS